MWGAIIAGLVSLYSNYTARQQQSDATNAALDQEQAAISRAQEASAPALGYFKNVIARGTALTPAQQQYVADTRQQTGSALSSRLGGRSATAIASRAATDVNNATLEANQTRSDQAATMLANPNVSGAGLILAAGQDRARAARTQGDINAGATLAYGNLVGQGIGQYYADRSNQDLLDAIRRSSADRPSAYQQPVETNWNPSYKLR